MRLTSPAEVRELLERLDIRPSKALGQNFLVDKNILNILLDAADLSSRDCVLEVGPGLGVVTEQLVELSGHVIAVEKDSRLAAFLKERLGNSPKLELICADILLSDTDVFRRSGVNKIVANLPYSVGGRWLAQIMKDDFPADAVVTVQQEVAERLTAQPGDHDYGLLTVWAGLVYSVSIIKTVSPTCFFPKPEVRSAIVRLLRHNDHEIEAGTRRIFHKLTKTAFAHRRKQIGTILSRIGDVSAAFRDDADGFLEELSIDPRTRPEDLSVGDWCRISSAAHREGRHID